VRAGQPPESAQSIDQDRPRLMGGVLAQVRWVVLAALVILSFTQPLRGRTGIAIWTLMLIFVGYNLLFELLRRRIPWLRSFTHIALLDLPIVAVLYTFSATTGGLLLVLFLLITACAAASMSLRGGVIYTFVVAVVVALIAPTLPLWSWTPINIRELGVELIIIVLVGIGTALFTHSLAHEQQAAESSRVLQRAWKKSIACARASWEPARHGRRRRSGSSPARRAAAHRRGTPRYTTVTSLSGNSQHAGKWW
jgi:hypothetical protein